MPSSVPVDATAAAAYVTVFSSAARTATATSSVFSSNGCRGLVLIIDATALSATPSVTFTIQGVSPLGSDTWTILASAAVTSAATSVLRVYPGLTASANLVANDVLPGQWQVTATAGDSDSLTYSVTAYLIP